MDCSTFAFDLHVLGTPPALILSQDQTLMLNWLAALSSNTTRLTRADMWLCVVQSVCGLAVRSQSSRPRLTTSIDRLTERRTLTLCSPGARFARAKFAAKMTGFVCVLARTI